MLIPDERTVLGAHTTKRLSALLGRSGAHDKGWVFNSGNPVPIDGDLLLLCVELVQVDGIVINPPLTELLLSDIRQMAIIVKLGLFDWNFDACRYKVQALI